MNIRRPRHPPGRPTRCIRQPALAKSRRTHSERLTWLTPRAFIARSAEGLGKGVSQLKRVLVIGSLSLGIIFAAQAEAACPQGQEVFTSCRIEGRNTEVFVCHDDEFATYSYGTIGQPPDLFLSETIENVDFRPWSGLGKAILESVVFYNLGYSYEVVGGFDRPFSEDEMERENRHFGWIEIAQYGNRLGRLECVPETVTYGFGGGLYDAKLATRQDWDDQSGSWVSVLDQVMSPPALREHVDQGIVKDCLRASEFGFDGVQMGDPLEMLGKLASPEATDAPASSRPQMDRMTVPGLRIDIRQDKVVGMVATSRDWDTPTGLRVGLSRGEVTGILGHAPRGQAGDGSDIHVRVCPDPQGGAPEWHAVIGFGQDDRVQEIGFASAAP